MGNIPARLLAQVRERDGGICLYCHSPETLALTKFEIDHIIPISSGGSTNLENLCLACPACNRYKGAFQLAIDPISGNEVTIFLPLQQQWSKHFVWSEDQYEIQGLTPTGRATVVVLRMNRTHLVNLRQLWRKLGYRLSDK